jgi:hypothetical protein
VKKDTMSDKAKEVAHGPPAEPGKGEKRARGRPRKPKSDEVVLTFHFYVSCFILFSFV